MGESSTCLCPRGKKPRIFMTFCCLFSVCIGVMSSLFLYYPDGLLASFSTTNMTRASVTSSSSARANNNNPNGEKISNFQRAHSHLDDMDFIEAEETVDTHRTIVVDYAENEDASNNDENVHSMNPNERIRHQGRHHTRMRHLTLDNLEPKGNYSNVVANRLMHFDLKGAPPKVSYMKEILKLAKASGITGILLEWEDTFPWTGSLNNTRLTSGGYSQEEAEEVVNFAENKLGLEVIPLVQTFGHVEFVLKGEKFRHLREVDDDPQAYCPSKTGTMEVIQQMIDQTLQLHKNARFIHIGCDEVFNLRICNLCSSSSSSKDNLFISHVAQVASYVRSKGRIPIIWDDMLRSIPLKKLQESQLGALVEPMVWVYAEEVDRFVGWEAWDKYSAVFGTVWVAAAFKGAFGETLTIPPLSRHADNVQRWINVVSRESPKWVLGLGGMVLTGWQRYDHFAVLCEVLPAAVPSLVYTSLVLSTPGGGDVIRNRIFVVKGHEHDVSTTIEPGIEEEESESVPNDVSVKNVTVHIEMLGSSENKEKILSKRSVSSPLAAASEKRRKIPHPRTLMANKEPERIAKFAGGTSRKSTRELLENKEDRVSRQFVQILHCPNHHTKVSDLIRESDIELAFGARCNFPGVAFFRTLFRLRSLVNDIWEAEAKVNRKRGWVTPYNIRHNYSLPLRVDEVVFNQLPRLRRNLGITAKAVKNSLRAVFHETTILEWIEQNVWPAWKALERLEKAGQVLKSVVVWPPRPLKSPDEMTDDLHLSFDDREEL